MNDLNNLITKLKLEDNSVAFKGDWAIFSPEIRASLNIIRPDIIYHFNKQPFILFFDFTKPENKARENTLHKQIWCFDKAPIAFFIFEDEIQIYNAFRYQREYDRLEKLDNNNYEKQFSFWMLQSGNTWDWLQKTLNYPNIKKYRVDQKLFDNIKDARKKLTVDAASPLDDTFANILILRLIFIRYLIDRDVKIAEKFIRGNSLEERKTCFNNLIADKTGLNKFFGYLEERFNGNLFERKHDPDLTQVHLTELSRIFSAHKNQQFLFDVFDFSIIPVETISGIYESVIDPQKREENSAIYTPSFMVDYILAQTINDDYLKNNKTCRVLDPACGSGIFLVQAYRKMVEYHQNEHSEISDEKLIELMQQNLFGIDKDLNALNVTAFSLYIAMLDYKRPAEINNFKLPSLLNTTLFDANFFDEDASFNTIFSDKQFDFILGNPPWGSKDEMYIKYNHKLPFTPNEIAQGFLARTKDFSGEYTQCALVVTSKAFYNTWAEDFRKYFFEQFHVAQLFDLSPVRTLIFENAKNPALIVFYRYAFGSSTLENVIKHFSVKPNLYLWYFESLVIEKQDQKSILQKHFIDYPWMLKLALYGNTIDFHFLKKLTLSSNTIKSFIENFADIYSGDGIKKLTSKAKVNPFTEIATIPILETDEIKEYYSSVNTNNLPTEEDKNIKSGGRIERYMGERIILARPKDETRIVASYVDTNCVYREKMLGISTENRIDELKILYGIFNSNLYTYYQFLTTSSWGVFHPEILHHEYLRFPYTQIQDKGKFIELVNEFIAYCKNNPAKKITPNHELLKQINIMVNEAYNVNQLEEDLIDYVLKVARYQFKQDKLKDLIRPPRPEELTQYAEVFYNHFSNIYNEGEEYFQVRIYSLSYFVAMTFNIVPTLPASDERIIFNRNTNEANFLQLIAESFSIHQESDQIFIQKDVKGFEEDFFYIIKPKEYKCWHRAMAHYDLAEFIEAIWKAEIEQMTENS